MITIECPHCDGMSYVHDDRQSSTLMCPKCGETLYVPPMADLQAPELSTGDYRAIAFWSRVMMVATLAFGVPYMLWILFFQPPFEPGWPILAILLDKTMNAVAVLAGVALALFLARSYRRMRKFAGLMLEYFAVLLSIGFFGLLVFAVVLLDPIFLAFFALYLLMCSPLYFMLRLYHKNPHAFR